MSSAASPPQPTAAISSLSLGATCPRPLTVKFGRMVKAAAPEAAVFTKFRLEIPDTLDLFLIVLILFFVKKLKYAVQLLFQRFNRNFFKEHDICITVILKTDIS